MKNKLIQLRILKNMLLLNLGFTMINYNAIPTITVKLRNGIQIKSDRARVLDYRMDDKGWEVLNG
jgi:hypothetical protein